MPKRVIRRFGSIGGLLSVVVGASLPGLVPLPTPRVYATPPRPAAPDARTQIARLVAAYPDQLCGAKQNAVVWCDGEQTVFDDRRAKTFDEKLVDADLEDQMFQEYVPGDPRQPARDVDPGRIRVSAFFAKMYGESAAAVRPRLTKVAWLPGVSKRVLRVTTVNGVAERLRAVSDAVMRLAPSSRRRVQQVAGGFRWRPIRGTGRPSMHSFGIAVDVGGRYGDYWRWARITPGSLLPYKNRIPADVVEAFERQGFIWGGRWYHYDTMHFEYRPELFP